MKKSKAKKDNDQNQYLKYKFGLLEINFGGYSETDLNISMIHAKIIFINERQKSKQAEIKIAIYDKINWKF